MIIPFCRWHLPGLARDTSPIVNYLYETTTSKTSVKGARFEFDDRPEVEEAEKDWEEELKTQGGVVCETIFAVEPTEDTKSDPESKEKLSQEGRASSRAERAAKRKVPESGSTVKTSKDQEAGPSGTAKKGRHGVVTPVKRDSKVRVFGNLWR